MNANFSGTKDDNIFCALTLGASHWEVHFHNWIFPQTFHTPEI